jgi:mono/diheme cytochrome c family protein
VAHSFLKTHLYMTVAAALLISPAAFAQDNTKAKPAQAEAAEEEDIAPAVAPAEEAEKKVVEQPKTAVVELYEPEGDVEAKAQAVLDKHCARCHQDGKLVKKDKPAKGFGNTMQLDELAANPKRILPGNPDGSPMFQVIANKQMPYDLYQGGDYEKPSVTDDDLNALRDWITGLKVECKPDNLGYKDIVNVMYQDLGSLPEHRRANTRYLSLANLKASCATEDEMKVYRQGAIRLLNHLSTNSDVLAYDGAFVDEQKTIVRFNLDDLNWTPELWEHIISQYPYGVRPYDSQYDALTQATYTQIPFIRADWLAFFGARPGLYEKILNLPPTYQELEKQLGLDTFENIRKYIAKRSGFKESGVSQHNRLIERHPISTGYFWTSYDFGGTKTKQNLFENPLGPKGIFAGTYSYGDDHAFEHDGGESIFSLPNGYQAYYLNTADGKSLEKGPTNIVRDTSRTDLAVTNGISCMGCHDLGMKNAVDDIRPHVVDNRLLSNEAREGVKALYPEKEEMNKIIENDRKRFINALVASGLDPNLKHSTDGEPVNALSNRYERDLDAKSAAAEFGVELDKLDRYLRGGGQIGGSFAAQLVQGTVQRDTFEAEFPNLVEFVIDGKYIAPGAAPVSYAETKKHEVVKTPISSFKITLHSDKAEATVGEPAYFSVTTTKDCYLTLINIDSKDTGTVIFPNKFSQDNFISAGKEFLFPSSKDGYDFKFQDKGIETVIAMCDTSGKAVDINHDYTKEEFTQLGRSIAVTKRLDNVAPPPKKKVKDSAGKGFSPDVVRTAVKIKVH